MPPKQSTRKTRVRSRRRQFGIFNTTASGDDEEDLDYTELEGQYDGEAADYGHNADLPSVLPRRRSTTTPATKRARIERSNSSQEIAEVEAGGVCYFANLPAEIYNRVLELVVDLETGGGSDELVPRQKRLLAKYCTVNVAFRDFVQPTLFRHLKIVQLKALYQFSALLEKSENLRTYIKHIRLELQSSLEEESNMVAAAIRTTIPRCTSLATLEVIFKAPLGFQVIFPLLGRDFYAPSVERLQISLGIFTSSFIPFVAGFSKLRVLHLSGINFDRLLLSDKDLKLSLSSITTLLLEDCIIGETTVQLFSAVLPKVETICLYDVKGLATDFLLAMKAHCASFTALNVYRSSDAKGRLTSRQPFKLPLQLWTSLSEVRILFCGSLRADCFPTCDGSDVSSLANLKVVHVAEMMRASFDHEYIPPIVRALARFADVLNSDEGTHRFNVHVTLRRALQPHAALDEVFTDRYLSILKAATDENFAALYTAQDEIGKGAWAVARKRELY